jgi:hypothetical protein
MGKSKLISEASPHVCSSTASAASPASSLSHKSFIALLRRSSWSLHLLNFCFKHSRSSKIVKHTGYSEHESGRCQESAQRAHRRG